MVAAIVCLGFTVGPALGYMWGLLTTSPEYSHGLAIPVISAWLVWQRRDVFALLPAADTLPGAALAVIGVLLAFAGRIGTIFTLEELSLLVTLLALFLSFLGARVFRQLRVPFLMLLLMIPLPQFLQQNLSAGMQLLSSKIGVWFIRLFGISVYLEGNVIDLGIYKLQVAEACDGLRYLFPLMTLGFIAAYLFHAQFWKRALLFVSTIPLTILMNSFRIGVIGLTVDRWGVAMAEGFLHAFQGWLVFMITCVLLMLEMMLLARIGPDRRPWREVFGFAAPPPAPRPAGPVRARPLPAPFLFSVALVLLYSVYAWATPPARELTVARVPLVELPMQLADYSGRRSTLESIYTDQLQLDDYLLADYSRAGVTPTNLYIAWYDSQQGGRSAHSPRSCLPAGGWRIESLTQIDLPGIRVGATPLRVNRVLIALGNQRQLVYYWFQQRGRIITDEYTAKWYLFEDALTRHRTDGALVRLVTGVPNTAALAAADAELTRFAATLAPTLPRFVPD